MDLTLASGESLLVNIGKLPQAESITISRTGMVQLPRLITHLPNLRSLDLSSNPIQSLDPLWEANLPNLHFLNLSACWLKKLPYGTPTFANTLEILKLDGNFLGRSCPNFSVFKKLSKLSLIANNFSRFPVLPPNITTLLFRMNSFKTIPDSSLRVLDASYCSIGEAINIEARQITDLRLSHCGLTGVIRFPPMPLLDVIDLSNNSITGIVFESSRRITELRLAFNGLDVFPEFLRDMRMLRVLDLSHNAIDTLPKDLTSFKRLEYLDLSHNMMITPNLITPSKLAILKMSFNFSIGFENLPPNLRQLDASFCSVVVLPAIPTSIEWIALYFVKSVIIRETMKALTVDSDEITNALAPVSMFQERTVVLTSPAKLDIKTLMNEKMADNVGCSTTSGRSTKYEDNLMFFAESGVSFSGIFDGHVGIQSAFVSAETFSRLLGPQVATVFDDRPAVLKTAMKETFALVNDELRRRAVKDGTTAVIVGIKGRRICVAHLGDSLALLVNSENVEWLTKTHRPTEKEEYERMKLQRKAVTEDWRVDGKLCVSRSLGDFWCCDGMYDDPDVSARELGDDAMSIVLGCDGLWDYIDASAVANVVRSIRDPVRAARLLQDYAFACGSHDSISVIVINVVLPPPIKQL